MDAKTQSLVPPQSAAAELAAHLRFLRDLGIGDFYRRPASQSAMEQAAALHGWMRGSITGAAAPPPTETRPAAPRIAAAAAAAIPTLEDSAIPLRKPLPSQPPIGSYIAPEGRAEALLAIRAEIGECTRCALSRGRNKIVFGNGEPSSRLMFVGEGPGADEDAQGLPFVGRAGQLLNNMIAAMGLRREQVYVANIVKCRPPQNRVPEAEEAQTCSRFLFQQIDVVRPEVLVALGSTAALYLLGVKSSLAGLRGRLHTCRGSKLIVTYHPAFLLRDPRQKKEAWQDLQLAMSELGLQPPQK